MSATGDEEEEGSRRQESLLLTTSTSGMPCRRREATSDPRIECNESEDNGGTVAGNGNPADYQPEQKERRRDDDDAASGSEEAVTVMMMAVQKEGMAESPSVQGSEDGDSWSSTTKASGDGRHAGGLSAGTSLTLSILILVLAAVLLIICFLLRIRDQSGEAGAGNETKVISLQRSQHDSSIYFDKSPVVPDASADEEADMTAVYDKRPLASQT